MENAIDITKEIRTGQRPVSEAILRELGGRLDLVEEAILHGEPSRCLAIRTRLKSRAGQWLCDDGAGPAWSRRAPR